MAIFDAGFIIWGFLLIYALVIVAYYVWMAWANRSAPDQGGGLPRPDDSRRPARRSDQGGRP